MKLNDEQIQDAVREADLDWQQGWTLDDELPNRYITFARAVESAVLAQELLAQNAELQARLASARELLNEYRRGMK